jgi:hypothetical protein
MVNLSLQLVAIHDKNNLLIQNPSFNEINQSDDKYLTIDQWAFISNKFIANNVFLEIKYLVI